MGSRGWSYSCNDLHFSWHRGKKISGQLCIGGLSYLGDDQEKIYDHEVIAGHTQFSRATLSQDCLWGENSLQHETVRRLWWGTYHPEVEEVKGTPRGERTRERAYVTKCWQWCGEIRSHICCWWECKTVPGELLWREQFKCPRSMLVYNLCHSTPQFWHE